MTKHAIILIKKDNQYLQYKDERWDSLLFPNTKIFDNPEEDIKKELKQKFSIEITNLIYLTDKIHTKYSVSHQEFREYHHFFYQAEIKEPIPNNFEFYSIEELEKNKRVLEVNKDILDFIKEIEKTNS